MPLEDQELRKLTLGVTLVTRVRLTALSTLLQQPESRIVDKAIELFAHSLPSGHLAAVEGLTELAVQNSNAQEQNTPAQQPASTQRYVLTNRAATRRQGTVVSGIIEQLSGHPFDRAEFRAAVAKVLSWDEKEHKFKGKTRFRTLDQAVAAWWNEFKNKLDLLRPED